jgi:hypothetical protein
MCITNAQAGVALASASDLSFNWTGFISAMVSNLTFGFRAVFSKKCAPSWDRTPNLVIMSPPLILHMGATGRRTRGFLNM